MEQYTRRENFRFNKIPEVEREDCKALVYDIIDRDLDRVEQDRYNCTFCLS